MMISSSMLWAQSSIYDLGPKKVTSPIVSDAQFDLQFDWPVGIGGGEAGIETNGNYIYTSKWNGSGEYYKYQMDGNLHRANNGNWRSCCQGLRLMALIFTVLLLLQPSSRWTLTML